MISFIKALIWGGIAAYMSGVLLVGEFLESNGLSPNLVIVVPFIVFFVLWRVYLRNKRLNEVFKLVL